MENNPALDISNRAKAIQYIHHLADQLVEAQGSDIFITAGSPPTIKFTQELHRLDEPLLTPQQAHILVYALLNERQTREFEQHRELNFSMNFPNKARFRVSAFTQRGSVAMVLRLIQQEIPTIRALHLPPVLEEIAMAQRGLVIFLGGTGCGKTTSLAAMLDHRNERAHDHIITIEDPIEFFHRHKRCLVDQREIGTDTDSYAVALKNTLRQVPNVIMIGEIRDQESMRYAINFAETGHLCLTSLHAHSTDQAFERIMSFFPEEKRTQVLMDLSFNVKALVAQRLIPRMDQLGLIPVVEVMVNTPLISDLILRGRFSDLKIVMARADEVGSITLDGALFDLYEQEQISYETAMRHADSPNELRQRIRSEGHEPASVVRPQLQLEKESAPSTLYTWP